jgi:CRISPR/Cas system type I-B associated protein Csh2 (Cas7 group RAMP superfamily)
MMSDLQAKFEKVFQKLEDAYDGRYITLETYDRIEAVMRELYPDEAKSVSVKNGDMDEDDPAERSWATIPEIFDVIENKKQFISDLDIALAITPKHHHFSDIVEAIERLR